MIPPEAGYAGADAFLELQERARLNGDRIEAGLAHSRARLDKSGEIRRFDVFADQVSDIAVREARSFDVFVALRVPARLGRPSAAIISSKRSWSDRVGMSFSSPALCRRGSASKG